MKFRGFISAIIVILPSIVSCRMITYFSPDGEVVAKVGNHKLYSTEIENVIPTGISYEDSLKLALQYINTWASEQLFLDVAERELSKEELDVSRELDEYKRSLLKYRYEQQYINQRLDTTITDRQLNAYYDKHAERFILDVPVVKARFMVVSKSAPRLAKLKEELAYNVEDDAMGDSLAYSAALRYTDYGGKWISAATLAAEFGTDYETMFSKMRNSYIEMESADANLCIAYILDRKNVGEAGPVEYYYDRIRDILLSARKQSLLSGLERELMEKARAEENFEIHLEN